MKARTRKTRWLLTSLLVGLLAAAGLTFTCFRGAPTLARANEAAAPVQPRTPPPPAHESLVASTGGPPTPTPGIHWGVVGSSSNSHTPGVTGGHTDSPANDPTAGNTGWSNRVIGQTDDTSGTPPPQNHPATAGTGLAPRAGSGDFAYQVYAPLGCELPAGCGGAGQTPGYTPRQTTGASGGLPAVHDSQGNDDQGAPPNNGSPQTNDSGQSPPDLTPPGQTTNPPTVTAPELDAATLAGAVTLLLGALAILRGRRPARARR